jgi:hypothetical protein
MKIIKAASVILLLIVVTLLCFIVEMAVLIKERTIKAIQA